MKQLRKTTYGSGIPVFQIDDAAKTVQGGFTLDTTGLVAGSIIPIGTVIGFDAATRVAKVLKSATVVETAAADATAYRVAKGGLFAASDNVQYGGVAVKINSINTTDPNYDVLNVATTLGAIPEGGVLVAAAAVAAEDAALPFEIATGKAGLLNFEVKVGTDIDVTVRERGTVYARRIPAVSDEVKKALPNIIFSQSY